MAPTSSSRLPRRHEATGCRESTHPQYARMWGGPAGEGTATVYVLTTSRRPYVSRHGAGAGKVGLEAGRKRAVWTENGQFESRPQEFLKHKLQHARLGHYNRTNQAPQPDPVPASSQPLSSCLCVSPSLSSLLRMSASQIPRVSCVEASSRRLFYRCSPIRPCAPRRLVDPDAAYCPNAESKLSLCWLALCLNTSVAKPLDVSDPLRRRLSQRQRWCACLHLSRPCSGTTKD